MQDGTARVSRRCLAVDDNAFNREVLKALLHAESHSVTMATNGAEALEAIEAAAAQGVPFELVLTQVLRQSTPLADKGSGVRRLVRCMRHGISQIEARGAIVSSLICLLVFF